MWAARAAEAEARTATFESSLRTARRHAKADERTAEQRGVQKERRVWKEAKKGKRESRLKNILNQRHEARREQQNRRKGGLSGTAERAPEQREHAQQRHFQQHSAPKRPRGQARRGRLETKRQRR